ncbi:unnamed protein product [Cylicocyclus nassatus]|uniref:Peptidase aspartic putative domain-containing protein n=1 Tax=Cylicocyclus nassatus TaxID=53992 RepID=A0AA36GNR0_CYLNA|nr:unnamed protein product [Cylicocyclus nassatus]CAJ0595391.1 unnamed protein product [Cylicocyclus nassatus]
MSTALNLKTVKQKLSRLVNTLSTSLKEAEEYQEPWQFPTEAKELQHFLLLKSIVLKNLCKRLEEQKERVWKTYEDCTSKIYEMLTDSERKEIGTSIEIEFNAYWEDKKGDDLLQLATELYGKLENRLVEIECQEASLKFELMEVKHERENEVHRNEMRSESTFTFGRHLLGGIKIPEFDGKASEFDSFWEIFEEIVDKQPYSNIEKFSILLNCCKGDAARALRMFPRTSESYDKAIQQLKTQFQDPKRVTMMMIGQLKAMKQCRDEPRSLRNNLNDVQAIIATLRKKGEVVDTTNMISMVLEKFSKAVQDEVMRKEFDSGNDWNMEDLLNNISAIVRRQEHLEGRKQPVEKGDELTIFQLRTAIACTGCGRNHLFQSCPIYRTPEEKIERLKSLKACWKCFSKKHHTKDCRRPNCSTCHGFHSVIICKTPKNEIGTNRNWSRRTKSPGKSSPRPWVRNEEVRHGMMRQSDRHKSPKRITETRQESGTNLTPKPRLTSPKARVPRVRFSRSPTPPRQNRNNTRNCYTINLSAKQPEENSVMSRVEISEHARLMIVPTRIFNNANSNFEVIYALLDSAADQSFICKSVLKRMQIDIETEMEVTVTTFGGRAENKRVGHVSVTLFNNEGEGIDVDFLTHEKILPKLHLEEISREDFATLKEYFAEYKEVPTTVIPQILIGIDYFNIVIKMHAPVIRLPSGLFVTSTFFGPVISGRSQSWNHEDNERYYEHVLRTYTVSTDDNIIEKDNMDYSDLWKLQGVGIEEFADRNEENQRIIEEFYAKVRFENNKIFVCFPWKSNKCNLADNYTLAVSRLHQLLKMKDKNPQCWKEYCKILDDQLTKNFVKEVFMTNDAACNRLIDQQDLYKGKNVKILGIPWNPQNDTFSIRCKLRYEEEPTKRKVLQAIHSTFDPLGYLIPLLLQAKVFLQSLWKTRYEWDDPLSPDDETKWKTICENVEGSGVMLPRHILQGQRTDSYELHTFVDASATSYAAAVYIRTLNRYGTVQSGLLMARQRLAPMTSKNKRITIPRLELLALLIGTRLTSY